MRVQAVSSALLAILLAACGGRTVADEAPAALAFPVGTYSHCASGTYTEDGSFLNASGFVEDAFLDVKQTGSTLTADYADPNGPTESFEFALTTNTSATLSPAGQTAAGFTGICVLGVGVSNEKFYAAELSADAGALVYDSGAVFVTMTGQAAGDGGECGPLSSAAGVWLVCDGGPSTKPIAEPAPSPVPELPTGGYACSSHLGTYYQSDGVNQIVASGGEGTLTLSQQGSELSAAYGADKFIDGTMHFGVATATTAHVDPAQTLTTPCEVPIGMGTLPNPTPETLPVSAGALMLDGSTLFLSFTGTMDESSSCAGAQKVGSIICSEQ